MIFRHLKILNERGEALFVQMPSAYWPLGAQSIDGVKESFKDGETQHHLAVCVKSEEVSKIANNWPRLADLASNKIASICMIFVASSWQQSCHTNI